MDVSQISLATENCDLLHLLKVLQTPARSALDVDQLITTAEKKNSL